MPTVKMAPITKPSRICWTARLDVLESPNDYGMLPFKIHRATVGKSQQDVMLAAVLAHPDHAGA